METTTTTAIAIANALMFNTDGFEDMLAEKLQQDLAEQSVSARKVKREISREERAERHAKSRKKAARKNRRNRGNKPYMFRRSGYFWDELDWKQKAKLPISSIEDYFDELELETQERAEAEAKALAKAREKKLREEIVATIRDRIEACRSELEYWEDTLNMLMASK